MTEVVPPAAAESVPVSYLQKKGEGTRGVHVVVVRGVVDGVEWCGGWRVVCGMRCAVCGVRCGVQCVRSAWNGER